MIKFIDVESKRVYDADSPYVTYVGNGCSTGKWYTKSLIAISDSDSITVSVPQDSLFWLMDADLAKQIIENDERGSTYLNGHKYADISRIKKRSMEFSGTGSNQISVRYGAVDRTFYYYIFHIAFMTDSEGEFHDGFTITEKVENDVFETHVYEIAADAYMEDERLSIDLANEGIEIPDGFQRAVFPSNVRDESSDKILLNRKWKELLIEYWNVVANKGSYKSLENSIKFFEYGDLVRIEEYWKQKDGFGVDSLFGRDIEQTLDPLIRKYLDVFVKTTYIGISLTIDSILDGETGEIEYTDLYGEQSPGSPVPIPEPVPVPHELDQVVLKHTVEDLTLKMTLLANYFSTYFMPIHLDLIHSSVDRVVFTNTVKILRGTRFRTESWSDSINALKCNLSSDSDYWLGNVSAYTYPDTELRNEHVPLVWGDYRPVGVSGYEPDGIEFSDTTPEKKEKLIQYLNQYFNGVGCIVKVRSVVPVKENVAVKKTGISVYRQTDGDNYELANHYESDDLRIPGIGNTIEFDMLFTRSGKYCVILSFTETDGSEYSGSWYINIHGEVGNTISIKRMEKIDYRNDQQLFDDWFYDNLDFNDFMFTQPFYDQIAYKQWLVPTDGSDLYGIGMNHVVVLDLGQTGNGRPIEFKMGDNEPVTFEFFYDDPDNPKPLDSLREEFPHYWWKVLVRNVAERLSSGSIGQTTDTRYYLVGVRKYFDTECIDKNIYEKYNKVYKDGEIQDIDAVIVNYTGSKRPSERGFLTVTCPTGSVLWIDGCGKSVTESEVTTIPVRKGNSTLHIEYTSCGHLFKTDVEVPDMFSMYGQEDYKVHPTKQSRKKGYTTIDTSRFFPIFHRLSDIEGTSVDRSETVVCIPDLRWTGKEMEDCYWEFVNKTTGETFDSKSMELERKKLYIEQPFVGRYDYAGCPSKGYYDVSLHYSIGGTEQTETLSSAFKIE